MLEWIGVAGGMALIILALSLVWLGLEWVVRSVRLRLRVNRDRKARRDTVRDFVEHSR